MNNNKNHVQDEAFAKGFIALMGKYIEKQAYYGSQYGQMPMYPTYGHGFYDGSGYAPQQQEKKKSPWYKDPWVWGGVGAAGVLGGAYAHNTGMLDPVYDSVSNWFGGASSGNATEDSSNTTDASPEPESQTVANTGQSSIPTQDTSANEVPNNANVSTGIGGPTANNSQDIVPKNQDVASQSQSVGAQEQIVNPRDQGNGQDFALDYWNQRERNQQLAAQQEADYQKELQEEYQSQMALKQQDESALLQQAGNLGSLSQVARDLSSATDPVNKNSLISEYMRQRQMVSENIKMLEQIGDPRAEGLKAQLGQISQQVGSSLFGGSDIGDAAIGTMRFDEHSGMRDALSQKQDQLDYLQEALTYGRFGNEARESYYFDQLVNQADQYTKAIQDYKAQGLNTAGFERQLQKVMSGIDMLRDRMSGGSPIGLGGG